MLGSVNLSEFVTLDKEFDFDAFTKTVMYAVKALNDVLDEGMGLHPLKEQRDAVRDWRQIGLGIMGLADMLIKMELPYGSEEAINLCDWIGRKMMYSALAASCNLTDIYGIYPSFDYDKICRSTFYVNHVGDLDFSIQLSGLRNSQLLTIAPTGSLSSMLGISGGIEPIYANSYTRKTESLHGHDEYYKVYTPIVKEYMDAHGITDERDLPSFFVTAKDIKFKDRIDMQAVWQSHIDASISSTINLPNSATVDDIEELYMYAWEQGLKGVTIFRDGCARTGILSTDAPQSTEPKVKELKLDDTKPITRDELGKRLSGSTYVKNVACGKLYITINRDDNDNLVEVFIDSGKSGGCAANAECLGRYASAAMRNGMSIDSIVDITKGVKCSACTQVKGSRSKVIDGLSCGDVVARTIQEEYERIQKNPIKERVDVAEVDMPAVDYVREKCPDCGDELAYEGGCKVCKNCGWSKCD